MKLLKTEKEINEIIHTSNISVIYFTARVKSGEIDGEKHPDICAEFNVFSLPLLILYVDEKESIRIGRNIDLLSLERNIERYYNMIYEK